jgi:hypothetical protein
MRDCSFFFRGDVVASDGARCDQTRAGGTGSQHRPRAWITGAGWEPVYDILVKAGYPVSVAQHPLTSVGDDVSAVKRVLAMQDGPTILVGLSYGGALITAAGNDAHRGSGLHHASHPTRLENQAKRYAVAKSDRIINPDLQRMYAKRARSHTIEVEDTHAMDRSTSPGQRPRGPSIIFTAIRYG